MHLNCFPARILDLLVTDNPSEDQKTKPYAVLTSSKWPGLIQIDHFQHSTLDVVFETE